MQQIFKLNWFDFKTRNVDIFSIQHFSILSVQVATTYLGAIKVIILGKLFQMCTHLLYCSVLSLGDNGIHLSHKKSMKYSGHRKLLYEYQNCQNQCFYLPRKLDEHWCIYSCLQIPPRENWFQYVRRVYATAINFPCITPLCCLGNVFVIGAILLDRHLQSVANYLILSLAVADLLVALLVMPLGAVYEVIYSMGGD